MNPVTRTVVGFVAHVGGMIRNAIKSPAATEMANDEFTKCFDAFVSPTVAINVADPFTRTYIEIFSFDPAVPAANHVIDANVIVPAIPA